MIEDKNIFEKIRKVVAAHDTKFEAEAEAVAEEDAKLIEKIQKVMEKDEAFLEAAAEKVEAEEAAEEPEMEEPAEEELEAEEAEAEEPEVEEPEAEEPAEEEATEAEEPEAEEPAEEEVTEAEEPETEEPAEEEATEVEESEVEVPAEPEPLPVPPTGEHRKHWMTVVEDKFKSLKPKTKVGAFFAKDRHNATLCAIVALGIITGGWKFTEYLIPQHVTIEYATFEKAETIDVSSRSTTVEGVLKDSGLKINKHDYVDQKMEHEIKDGDTLYVKKAVKSEAEIAGKKQTFYLIPGTVEANLEFNEIEYDEDDIVTPARDAEVGEQTQIVVKEVHYVTEEKTEKVASKSVVVLDPSMASGTTARTSGHDGEGIFTYKTTYVNGVATGTSKEVKKWITKPEDTSFRLGTSETGHSGTYTIAQTFTANTTAYYMGEGARGASGGRCVYGTCAVDRSRFPFGTMFFVEGYGVAIANDTGGAVKDNVLDLWMHSYSESVQWGRRYVTAYVLQ